MRKRVATVFRIDTTGGPNVGPNPARTSFAAAQTNTQVQSQFASAILQLQDRLATCANDPAAAGCASVVGRETQAQQLISASQGFANTVAALYGNTATPGMAFVPRNLSSADTAVRTRVSDFNAQYKDFLGTSTDLLSTSPVGAGGPVGAAEFQEFVLDDLGGDSLNTQERLGFGDIEVGFRFRALQLASRTTAHPALRLTIASAVRLPTGSRRSTSDIADLSLGEGSVIVDSRAMLDVRTGRLGVLAAAQFAARVHDSDTLATTTRNTSWTEFDVSPRWHLSEPFALHAAYSFRSTATLGGDQLIGGGVTYSTLSAYENRRIALPLEMRFTHLEAVSGDAGRPKFFRDQLEVRVYFRLR
ncbi:MAG: hypothetical protein E6H78_19975 [Betaproteobacteria bacterium]|nr:MAG: hypothetical protein E6H78_19975 [Betaproteobacteria bacterium]